MLHNPDMGWVICENYPVDPDPHGSSTMLGLPDESFPDADAVALMFSWADIALAGGALLELKFKGLSPTRGCPPELRATPREGVDRSTGRGG